MSKFEIACVTMHQKDFSKIQEMNANQNIRNEVSKKCSGNIESAC